MRPVETSCGDGSVDIAKQVPVTHVPLQKLPQPPQWLCSLSVLKHIPSHTSGNMGGQPVGSESDVSAEVAAADNSGDPVGGDELIEGIIDLIADDRLGIGVDVLEIDDQPVGTQILKPLTFFV
jgi:hypothetical protein